MKETYPHLLHLERVAPSTAFAAPESRRSLSAHWLRDSWSNGATETRDQQPMVREFRVPRNGVGSKTTPRVSHWSEVPLQQVQEVEDGGGFRASTESWNSCCKTTILQFKSLSPKELQAFKRIKDAFEESLLPEDCRGSSHLFPRPWSLRQLQVWERPVTLEAELALTLKVLEAVTEEALRDVLDQPLHTLRHIQSQLQACGRVQPTAGPRLRGHLRNWLHQLQEAPKKESPGCLEASITFHLYHLLKHNLKCVADGHRVSENLNPPATCRGLGDFIYASTS
ncbi:interferon lambda-3-like [Otolemur garnettii]|uniref:interferon lambda-3-like n=1 Tax=Otolemur garnettii TaxID=30611 RepID=UPI000644017C|nr:interferon lambda-3-like [Otolemur garnettii]